MRLKVANRYRDPRKVVLPAQVNLSQKAVHQVTQSHPVALQNHQLKYYIPAALQKAVQ
jgi:hypothetical protein